MQKYFQILVKPIVNSLGNIMTIALLLTGHDMLGIEFNVPGMLRQPTILYMHISNIS